MKKKNIIYIVIGVAVLALLAWPKLKPNNAKEAPAAAKRGGAIKVNTIIVKPQSSVNIIETTGNILAQEEVILYPETQGRIVSINFTEGAQVQKGDLLVKINDAELQAQLKKAIATKKLKDDTEKRNKSLFDKGAISAESYDVGANELNSINADVDLIKEQIRKTEIRAPFSGKIGFRNVSEGSYVTSSTRIAALQSINQIKIEFAVPEKYAHLVNKGTNITFKIDGNSNNYQAVVYGIEPKIDEVTRNVVIRASCANPNQKILPGSFAKVSVAVGNNDNAFMIPTQAIVPILKGQKVYIVQGDSAVERIVKTGTRKEKDIEITEGLNAGDEVITVGVMYLKQGAKIKQ